MKFVYCFLVALPLLSYSQDYTQSGLLIDLNAAVKFNRDWSLKSKLQGRESLIQNESFQNEVLNPEYRRVDMQAVLQRKLGLNRIVGFGVLFRVSNRGELVRYIQQYGWVKEAYRLEWAQRIRLDETLRKTDDLEWRLRYRLGLQIPLQGFRLDKDEKYLITETELLGKYRLEEEGLESRLTFAYGSLFKDGSKGELGIDYRLDGIINSTVLEHQYWLTLTYFFK